MKITDPPVKLHPLPPATPLARALNEVGDKWALPVVRALRAGPTRYRDLAAGELTGISTEALRVTLARLLAAGIVTRTRYREVPPRVDYDLTDKGRDLNAAIDALEAWAHDNNVGANAADTCAALEAAGQTSLLEADTAAVA